MEQITKYNYEAFYLDYLEGNLSDIEISELELFLELNPNYKLELEVDLNDLALIPELINYPTKHDLKHFETAGNSININNYNDWLVAEVEGLLSKNQIKTVDTFVKANYLEYERRVMSATILKPDSSESFGSRAILKQKKTKVIVFIYRTIAIAAAILLIALAVNIQDRNEEKFKYSSRSKVEELYLAEENINEFNFPSKFEEITKAANTNSKKSFNTIKNNPTSLIQNDTVQNQDSSNTIEISAPNIIEKVIPIIPDFKQNEIMVSNIEPELEPVQKHYKSPIRLKDKYKIVTNTINNYTKFDVTYKQSDGKSDVAVTQIKIGKFSFERKRRI